MQRRYLSAVRSMRRYVLLFIAASTGLPGPAGAAEPAPPVAEAQGPAATPTSPTATATEPGPTAPAGAEEPGAVLVDDAAPDAAPPRPEDDTSTPADPGPDSDPGEAAAAPSEPAAAPQGPATFAETLDTESGDLDLVERQIQAKEYDTAREWLESHVRTLESSTHRYDPAYIRPLTLLGDAHMGKAEYVEALQRYQHATHVARVSAGLKSPEQIETVHREAAAYKALGQYQEASDREEYAYQILAGQAAPNDPALLPALYRLADWYMATGNAFAARELYARAIGILEANGQIEALSAIPALQGLATSYRMERFPLAQAPREELTASMVAVPELQQPMTLNNFPAGEQALQQIVRIRQQASEPDLMALVEAVLDLGDWYTLFDKPRRADPLYEHAFELLGNIPDTDRTAYFAEPRLLYLPAPGTPRESQADSVEAPLAGFVEVGFDVSETGYVRNLKTLASEPAGLMDLRVRRSLRVARYRPALVDGVPVTRANQIYRHEFAYRAEPEDETAEPAETAAEPKAEVAGE